MLECVYGERRLRNESKKEYVKKKDISAKKPRSVIWVVFISLEDNLNRNVKNGRIEEGLTAGSSDSRILKYQSKKSSSRVLRQYPESPDRKDRNPGVSVSIIS